MEKVKVAVQQNNGIADATRIDEMVRETIRLLGGMESIVKAGDTVVIKGNFFAPYPPPISIDRRVVASLIRTIKEAGAGRIVLTEAVSIGTKLGRGTSTAWILEELGVADAARAEGAEVFCLEDDERMHIHVPDAKSIEYIDYPKCLYDCDVLINLPCLKMHGMTLVTLGIKNFQGVFTDTQKYYAHRDDLEQKLVDVFKIRKPDLTFIDGLIAMEGNGSGEYGTPHIMNLVLASKDMVAADAVGAALMGIKDPFDVTSIRIADYDGIGCGDLNKIEVVGGTIEEIAEDFKYPDKFSVPLDKRLLAAYKNVDVRIGGACRQCWGLAWTIAKKLAKIENEQFTLIIGVDPKIANADKINLDNCIIFGDCANACAGDVKEIRNRMLLEKKGCFANGCPPYRPAAEIIDNFLMKRGFIEPGAGKKGAEDAVNRTFAYYKGIDPTWVPKSEQNKG